MSKLNEQSSTWSIANLSLGSTVQSFQRSGVSTWILLLCSGVLVAILTTFWHPGIRVPGSSILRSAVPYAFAFSLLSIRSTGLRVAVVALACYCLLAPFTPSLKIGPMVTSVLLGPAFDWLRSLITRLSINKILLFAGLGVLVNSINFCFRYFSVGTLLDPFGLHQLNQLGLSVWMSFALCGALAGLACGFADEISERARSVSPRDSAF